MFIDMFDNVWDYVHCMKNVILPTKDIGLMLGENFKTKISNIEPEMQ